MFRLVFFFALSTFTGNVLLAQSDWFSTGQAADLMISGKGFNHTGGQFNHPNGLASDGTHLLLCDRFNNRVLVWNTLPEIWDEAPDLVLGQPDFTSNNPGADKNELNWAGNVSLAANGKLAIADTENDRILLWNTFPNENGQAADVSLFLPSIPNPNSSLFYAWPWGVWTDGQRLVAVATTGASLLFWNTFPTADNTPPDYVVHLQQFGTPRNISTDGSTYFFVGDHNAKVNNGPGTFFWNSFPAVANQPYDFYRDEWIKGEKLPGGQLVAGGLQSIYIWNEMPTAADHNPDLTLQPAVYKNGDGVDLAWADERLFINNYNGNNVLVYNGLPVSSSQNPDWALGAPTISTQTLDSIFYTQNPVLITDGSRLIASSDFDRALYVWNSLPTISGQAYDQRIQMQGNVQLWGAALHNNTLVCGGRNTLSVWENAANLTASPDYTLVNHIGSAMIDDIRGVALDDQFFYLATHSGQLYVWQGLPDNTSTAPLFTMNSSSGGPFSYLYSDGEYLCAARPEPPSGVDIYRVADLSAGITTPFKVINSGQVRINQASQAVTFNGALALSSRGDHRVLLWEEPAHWGLPGQEVVLGQPGPDMYDASIGENRLFMPNSMAVHDNDLWVGEFKFSSRILKFSHAVSATGDLQRPTLSAQVFPNPAVTEVWLKLEAPESGVYHAELLAADGRRIHHLFSGKLTAGQRLEQREPVNAMPSGVYFIRWIGPSGRTFLKLEIQH